ncbi:MAG: hypothetical protein ABI442_07670 [Gemmatimonadaceae bacterium]
MSAIANGWKAIPTALRDLLAGLKSLGQTLRSFCRAMKRACDNFGKGRNRGGACITVSPAVLKRADPLIYAQYYLMKQGLSVTWDNPDIQISRGGVPVAPYSLLPATDYDVTVRVWNGSYDAPALNLPVSLSYLSFGIGVSSNPIGSNTADLDVKGGPLEPAFTSIPWKTPPVAGHYCLQALLLWPDDANPDNNLGQKNVQVGKASSPAVFDIQVHNDANVSRTFAFEADQYTLRPLDPCGPTPSRDAAVQQAGGRLAESHARWKAALAAQGYGGFPLNAGWSVTFTPARPILSAFEQITVQITVEPPPGFVGQHAVNVHGFAQGENRGRALAGGVTLLVEKS